jgi:HEAT repeat protein
MPAFSFHINKLRRLSFVMSLFMVACSANFLYAQRAPESLVSAVSIQTRTARSGTIVTLFADTALIRTQTWRDVEGFHIVLPSAGHSRIRNVPRGIKVHQVGKSLEVLVRLRPGADVRVQALFNRLTLFINGELDVSRTETFAHSPLLAPCRQPDGLGFRLQLSCGGDELLRLEPLSPAPVVAPLMSQPESAAVAAATNSTLVVALPAAPAAVEALNMPGQVEASTKYFPTTNLGLPVGDAAQGDGTTSAASAQAGTPGQTYPAGVPTTAYDNESQIPQAKIEIEPEKGGAVLSAFLSPAGAAVFLGQGVLLLFLLRQRVPARKGSGETKQTGEATSEADEEDKNAARDARGSRQRKSQSNDTPSQPWELNEFELMLDAPGSTQGAFASVVSQLFSEETIKQEVCKLVKGLPYRSEALSSRAANDRRAVEAALIEALNAPDLNEDERVRARQALEKQGFVLRRGAQLLSSPDTDARAAAARALAEMNSSASMPFLLEALYDVEPSVRVQVMSSLGAMKVPSAIGAVLEAALHHPDTPPSLLGNVLNACSFGQVADFKTWSESAFTPQFWGNNSKAQLDKGNVPTSETQDLLSFSEIEDLPESLDDENFAGALSRLEDADEQVRASAARALGQFRAWRSVKALISTAEDDKSASVRATAVTSLGNINHESVLAHLLIAFADEARDVRAAAARALSRLSIGRAAAFVRMLETADETMVHRVARACIKTGMVSQAIDKLNSPDRRQGYEAFLLLSLLEKADETQAISDAAQRCPDNETRLAALRLFGLPELPKPAPEPLPKTTSERSLEPLPKTISEPSPESSPSKFHPKTSLKPPRKSPPKSHRKLPPRVRPESPDSSTERGIMPLYTPKPVRK